MSSQERLSQLERVKYLLSRRKYLEEKLSRSLVNDRSNPKTPCGESVACAKELLEVERELFSLTVDGRNASSSDASLRTSSAGAPAPASLQEPPAPAPSATPSPPGTSLSGGTASASPSVPTPTPTTASDAARRKRFSEGSVSTPDASADGPPPAPVPMAAPLLGPIPSALRMATRSSSAPRTAPGAHSRFAPTPTAATVGGLSAAAAAPEGPPLSGNAPSAAGQGPEAVLPERKPRSSLPSMTDLAETTSKAAGSIIAAAGPAAAAAAAAQSAAKSVSALLASSAASSGHEMPQLWLGQSIILTPSNKPRPLFRAPVRTGLVEWAPGCSENTPAPASMARADATNAAAHLSLAHPPSSLYAPSSSSSSNAHGLSQQRQVLGWHGQPQPQPQHRHIPVNPSGPAAAHLQHTWITSDKGSGYRQFPSSSSYADLQHSALQTGAAHGLRGTLSAKDPHAHALPSAAPPARPGGDWPPPTDAEVAAASNRILRVAALRLLNNVSVAPRPQASSGSPAGVSPPSVKPEPSGGSMTAPRAATDYAPPPVIPSSFPMAAGASSGATGMTGMTGPGSRHDPASFSAAALPPPSRRFFAAEQSRGGDYVPPPAKYDFSVVQRAPNVLSDTAGSSMAALQNR